MKFRVYVRQEADGLFVAEVPSLPGCWSEGRTWDETIQHAQRAIEAYIESLKSEHPPHSSSEESGTVDINV
jgi:predicted RNase H-like HicB family nuclease